MAQRTADRVVEKLYEVEEMVSDLINNENGLIDICQRVVAGSEILAKLECAAAVMMDLWNTIHNHNH